jgi:hypothetical protein
MRKHVLRYMRIVSNMDLVKSEHRVLARRGVDTEWRGLMRALLQQWHLVTAVKVSRYLSAWMDGGYPLSL